MAVEPVRLVQHQQAAQLGTQAFDQHPPPCQVTSERVGLELHEGQARAAGRNVIHQLAQVVILRGEVGAATAAVTGTTDATGVRPAIDQIEWSPLLFDAGTLQEHRERDVAVEGYSALRGGTLDHPAIVGIAERLDRTPAQVIIRWHLQHDVVVIPKSTHPERIRSNADVGGFTLTDEDMATLDALGGR